MEVASCKLHVNNPRHNIIFVIAVTITHNYSNICMRINNPEQMLYLPMETIDHNSN